MTVPSSSVSPHPQCALHAYLTIPSYLFVDQYQLSSPNFLASRNLRSVRSLSGETDLEAPNWATSKWGSALLLELAPRISKEASETQGVWHADIPLHLRYLQPPGAGQMPHFRPPKNSSQHEILSLPWPTVFWACPTDEGTKMHTNPFDRVNLGYDSLFGPRTMFYHLQSASQGKSLILTLKAPIMDLTRIEWVQFGTVFVVSMGFLWVLLKLYWVARRDLGLNKGMKQQKSD